MTLKIFMDATDHRLCVEDLLAVEELSDVEFMVYGFPWLDPKTKTERTARHIRIKCGDQQERDEWIREINLRLRPNRSVFEEGELQSKREITLDPPFEIEKEERLNLIANTKEPKRKVIVLVNPFGGRGKAVEIWRKVKHVFRLAPIQLLVQSLCFKFLFSRSIQPLSI